MDATLAADKLQHENHLKAGLKSRHLTMMSIAGVIGGSLFVGSGQVPFADSLRGFLGRGDPLIVLVMQELRLPRALLAVLRGEVGR